MARRSEVSRAGIFRRLLGAVLVLALGPQGWAQDVSPWLQETALVVFRQQQEEASILASARVDPELVNKKVRVYCRDGRVYEGKLVEVARTYVRVKTKQATEQIDLTEITTIEKGGISKPWLTVAIVGLAIGAVATGALIAAMQD